MEISALASRCQATERMLLFFGLLVLLKSLATEGCSANQHSTASLTAGEHMQMLQNGTFSLPSNSTCQWNITAPEGKAIRIVAYAVNFSLPCDEEYFRIHDGPGESSKILAEYCANSSRDTSKSYFSSGRSLWLEAKKGLINSTSRVLVFYRTIDYKVCNANRHLTASLTAGNDVRIIQNGTFTLPFNSSCEWNITAPEGKIIRIDVFVYDFDLSCDKEYVRILDGPGKSSKILAEYCLTSTKWGNDRFYSSGRSLWIETKQGIGNYSTYLHVSYKTIDFEDCSLNTTLDAPLSPVEHNFSSPYWPDRYPINKTCGWYVTAPANHTVVLHLTYRLDRYSMKDKVEVYDADGSELSLVSVYGGSLNRKTATVYSKFRRLYVLFKSDDEKNGIMEEGLFVSYTAITPAHSCSSGNSWDENQNIVLKDPSGVIKTPGYPSNYPHNLIHQCYWKIFAPKGKVVRVDFSSFRLPRGTCVDVVNAINNKFPMKTTHCVEKPSFVVYSMTNELGIKVQEHYGLTGPGFTANYTVVTADSSGTCRPSENSTVHMAGEGMSFASPGFPLPPENGSCNWNISVPPGNFIKLIFWVFGPCNSSYAEVYDVTNSTWVYLGKFCSITTAQERVVYSKGNNLLVTYVTTSPASSSSSTRGFLASYETVKAVPATYACSRPGGLRTELHGTSGDLASYQYPMPYSNDASCSWTIEVPVGYLINLTFHSFDLQQSQNCQADYVAIKQGKYYFKADEIGRFCGSSLPGVIQSNTSKMYVDFVVDSSGRYPGFHASYVAVPNPAMGPCNTQGIDNVIPLSGESGRLYSPLYPQTFPNKMTCTWIISVPEGNFVMLKITSFFLAYICKEGTNLEIRDGQSSTSDLLKTFCGQTYESAVFSNGRYLWVRFQSSQDSFQYGTGFNALFETVNQLPASFSCTAQNLRTKLESETGTLASYNYPLPYDDSVECVWNINVDTDYKIELSFDFFNLSDSTDCSEDYVEVRDGMWDTSDLVGKYCGAKKPSKITSDAWDLRIAFKSSGKTKYPGFKASYETKKSTDVLYILKIVGICLGALSVLCIAISGCITCYKKSHNQGHPGMVMQGTDNTAHVADDTVKQTTSF
ncbi:hypothetical protein ACROYT_G020293 [Oculina patagonica]